MKQEAGQNSDDHVMTETERELWPLEWREATIRAAVDTLVAMGYAHEEVLSSLKNIQENIRKVKYISSFPTREEQQEALELALIEGFPPEVVLGNRNDVTIVEGNNTVH